MKSLSSRNFCEQSSVTRPVGWTGRHKDQNRPASATNKTKQEQKFKSSHHTCVHKQVFKHEPTLCQKNNSIYKQVENDKIVNKNSKVYKTDSGDHTKKLN